MLDAWSDTGGFWSGVAEAWRPVAPAVPTAAASITAQSATASPVVAVEVGCAQVSVGVQSGTGASVLSATDDGHWFTSGSFNGQLYNSSGDVVFGHRPTDTLNAFCRFSSAVPNGAEIISAVPVFTCKDACSGSYNLNLYFAAADNQSAPTTASIANAIPVTSAINWTGSTAWTASSTYQGPNVASILQEVVDRDGFESGNNVLLIIKENNSSAGTARNAYALEGDSTKKIKLLVEWRLRSFPVVTSTVAVAAFVQAASALPQATVQAGSEILGVSTVSAAAYPSTTTQTSPISISWSINAAEVTTSTGTDTTVSVSTATASFVPQIAPGASIVIAQAEAATFGAEVQTAPSSVSVLALPTTNYISLAIGEASGETACTATVAAAPATLAAQTATMAGLTATAGVAGVSAEVEIASASASCSPTLSTSACALSACGVTVSTESITVAHPGVARAAASGLSSTATCGCVANLDAVDLALIARMAAGAPAVAAASGQISISTALGQAGANSQSTVTLASAGVSTDALAAIGSPHIDAPATSLGVSIDAFSPSSTSATTASCSAARLDVALLQAIIRSGIYEIWRYDSDLVKSGMFYSLLPEKIFFDSSVTGATRLNASLTTKKKYDSNLAQYARFKTNVKVEKALV